MLKLLVLFLIPVLLTSLYLTVRSFHQKWKWQNKINENNLRQAIYEEAGIRFELAPDGYIRPVTSARKPSLLD